MPSINHAQAAHLIQALTSLRTSNPSLVQLLIDLPTHATVNAIVPVLTDLTEDDLIDAEGAATASRVSSVLSHSLGLNQADDTTLQSMQLSPIESDRWDEFVAVFTSRLLGISS